MSSKCIIYIYTYIYICKHYMYLIVQHRFCTHAYGSGASGGSMKRRQHHHRVAGASLVHVVHFHFDRSLLSSSPSFHSKLTKTKLIIVSTHPTYTKAPVGALPCRISHNNVAGLFRTAPTRMNIGELMVMPTAIRIDSSTLITPMAQSGRNKRGCVRNMYSSGW